MNKIHVQAYPELKISIFRHKKQSVHTSLVRPQSFLLHLTKIEACNLKAPAGLSVHTEPAHVKSKETNATNILPIV